MSVEFEIGPNRAESLVITQDDIESMSPVKTHTGLGDFSARIKGTRGVEIYAQRQDRINIKNDSETIFTGYLTHVDHNIATGKTNIKGRGIAKRLQETRPDYDNLGGSLTYENIALQDAIDDYWSRTPFTATVTDQTTEIVSQDQQLISVDTTTEWNDNISLSDTEPVYVEDGKLRLAQTGFVEEAENATGTSTVTTDGSYSDGGAAVFNELGDNRRVIVDLDYETSNLTAYARGIEDSTTSIIEVRDSNNNKLAELGSFSQSSVGWISDSLSGTFGPGTYDFRFQLTDPGVPVGSCDVDLIVIADSRYVADTFDNTLNEPSGYLDDPQLYPDVYSVESQDYSVSLNIAEATLTTTFDDITAAQQIGLSFDSGSTFTRESNTNTITETNKGSRLVRGEMSLAAYPQSASRDATPRLKYNGQTVDTYQIEVDLNDLIVIDKIELSNNHFDNLQTLHEYGDFIFVIEHDDSQIANLTVRSFLRGDETRTLPPVTDNEINRTPEISSEQYYNSIYLQGALVNGSRPTAEIKDQSAISNDRDEISPGVLRDLNITTEGGAQFRARALLNKAMKKNALRGRKVTPAVDSHPGYAYPVDFGEGVQEFTAEEVALSLSQNSAESTFDFVPRNDISQEVEELRKNSKQTQNRV